MHADELVVHARDFRVHATTELARQLGVDYMQVYRYERGQSLPSLATATRLASIFQMSLDALATGRDAPEPPPLLRNPRLLEQLRQLDGLPPERRELASRALDAVMAGELDALVTRFRRP